MRGLALAFALSLAFALPACSVFRPVVASSADLEDYRAFRVAAAEGTRLARAKRYLERHPTGSFADEVRAAFDEEEPRYFARAQTSREVARRYLADLPDGPHAPAVLALLIALESSMQEAELTDLARKVRYEDTKLEAAAVQRRAVSESILSAIAVFLEDDVYGAPLDRAPVVMRRRLVGGDASWGTVPSSREEDHFFLLPTRPDRESRLLTLQITAVTDKDDRVTEGRIVAPDMFVRWMEAEQIVRLDPALEEDRAEARVFAMTRIEGALERRFPKAACKDLRGERELYHRACGGWDAVVTQGAGAGKTDAVVIRGPVAASVPVAPPSPPSPPSPKGEEDGGPPASPTPPR